MLGMVKQDGQGNKYLSQIAGATLGQGVPLGAWCSFEKDVAPSSNWLMAGTTFDATKYPALNLYLGTNKVPSRYDHNRPSDYETMTYTANTDITLQYDGELVITQLTGPQDITRNIFIDNVSITSLRTKVDAFQHITIPFKKGQVLKITDSGLSLFVRYYTHPLFIKATSIASDSDKDSILAQIQEYNTYSTEETLTGKTWIDGKPIYRKCYSGLSISFSTSEGWRTLGVTAPDNVETIVKGVILGADATSPYSLHDIPFNPALVAVGSNNTLFRYNQANSGVIHSVDIEYTKTTD